VTVRRLWPRPASARIPLALAAASCRDRFDALHVQYVGAPYHGGALVMTFTIWPSCEPPERSARLQLPRLRLQVRANAQHAAVVITGTEHSKRDLVEAYGVDEPRLHVILSPPTLDGLPCVIPRPSRRSGGS
jgi:hypothetical protein